MDSIKSRRKLYVGVGLAALIAALGVGQAVLENKAEAQARTVQAPMFEVDPLWPKPLPNHWLLGMTIGVWVDDQDHVWIIHRGAATLNDNEKALDLKVASAARRRRRCWFSTRRATWCAPGADPGRVTSGRTPTTVCTWITRAMCGSAVTAPRTRTCSSLPATANS